MQKNKDRSNETPQYNSTKSHLGNYVTLLGTNACSTNYIRNRSFYNNEIIKGCSFELSNIYLHNASKVTLDIINSVNITGPFEVQTGSTFSIE